MTLTELRYIVALAETEHFGRAAQQCFVSQPTLSVAVKKLEEELGVTLFERPRNAVFPTELGKKVIAQARITLAQAAMIKELVQSDRDQLKSPLKVGAIHTVGPYIFPGLVSKLKDIAPQMPLYIEENFTANLRQKLLSAQLDAIIVALPFSEPDIVTSPLYYEEFLMLLHESHVWSKNTSIDTEKLIDAQLLLLGEGHCLRDQILDSCQSLKQILSQQQQTTQGSSLETIRMMVASGLGSSVVPATAVNQGSMQHLVTVPFSDPVPGRKIVLAWRASFPRSQAIDYLLQALHVTHKELKNDI